MRYRLQRHDGTDCSATMVPIQRYRQKNTVRVLMRVSLAGFTQCFRLIVWQKPQACQNSDWDAEISSALRRRLPSWS